MHHEKIAGTIGGTLLAVGINPTNLASTVIIAATGATVSFFMTIILKKFWAWITKK